MSDAELEAASSGLNDLIGLRGGPKLVELHRSPPPCPNPVGISTRARIEAKLARLAPWPSPATSSAASRARRSVRRVRRRIACSTTNPPLSGRHAPTARPRPLEIAWPGL